MLMAPTGTDWHRMARMCYAEECESEKMDGFFVKWNLLNISETGGTLSEVPITRSRYLIELVGELFSEECDFRLRK